jgi:phage-related protein
MSFPQFPLTEGPTIGTAKQVTPATLMTGFGDGYIQRVADGINHLRDNLDATWENLTTEEANTLETFLRARGAHEAFEWTPPREAVAKVWICQSYTRTYVDPTHDTMTLKLIQVFDT